MLTLLTSHWCFRGLIYPLCLSQLLPLQSGSHSTTITGQLFPTPAPTQSGPGPTKPGVEIMQAPVSLKNNSHLPLTQRVGSDGINTPPKQLLHHLPWQAASATPVLLQSGSQSREQDHKRQCTAMVRAKTYSQQQLKLAVHMSMAAAVLVKPSSNPHQGSGLHTASHSNGSQASQAAGVGAGPTHQHTFSAHGWALQTIRPEAKPT